MAFLSIFCLPLEEFPCTKMGIFMLYYRGGHGVLNSEEKAKAYQGN